MRLIITADVATWAANHLIHYIHNHTPTAQRPLVLGLPTGETPIGLYRHLVKAYRARQVSFRHVITFNLDEYVGLPPNHPASYHAYMARHFFAHVDIPPAQVYMLNGQAADLALECDRFEAALQAVGGLDLCLGGVGRNGHVGFNEPGSWLGSRTRLVSLAESTRLANARFFTQGLPAVPTAALTLGLGPILAARTVMILAQGSSKAEAIRHVLEAEVDPAWPISALQKHPQAIFVCDQDAALNLQAETLARLHDGHD
ncbi:MAG: glucosamine-6-phosphate deaminase [Nodosilinea sp.]